MSLFDKILRFFGIRRIDLDKPITLLGHYYYDVQDKVYHSAYSIYDDVDWGFITIVMTRKTMVFRYANGNRSRLSLQSYMMITTWF